jgi:hypothetical protein
LLPCWRWQPAKNPSCKIQILALLKAQVFLNAFHDVAAHVLFS